MKLLFDENCSLTHYLQSQPRDRAQFCKCWRDQQGRKIKELVETLSWAIVVYDKAQKI